jgi:hypothetical protein
MRCPETGRGKLDQVLEQSTRVDDFCDIGFGSCALDESDEEMGNLAEKPPPGGGVGCCERRWIAGSEGSDEKVGRGSDLDICIGREFIGGGDPGVGELRVEVGEEVSEARGSQGELGQAVNHNIALESVSYFGVCRAQTGSDLDCRQNFACIFIERGGAGPVDVLREVVVFVQKGDATRSVNITVQRTDKEMAYSVLSRADKSEPTASEEFPNSCASSCEDEGELQEVFLSQRIKGVAVSLTSSPPASRVPSR